MRASTCLRRKCLHFLTLLKSPLLSMETQKLFIAFLFVLNLIVSIAIILINKWMFDKLYFPNITLTLIHFFATSIGLLIAGKLFKFFTIKTTSLISISPLAFTFVGHVVCANLSLQFNTVGTYQISKTLSLPAVVILQYLLDGVKFSTRILITLVVI